MTKSEYRKIPALNKLINAELLAPYRERLRPEIFKKLIQSELKRVRVEIAAGGVIPAEGEIIRRIYDEITKAMQPSLRRVINATGVILHTNLGRAPLGEELLEHIKPVLQGYSNLEFDLEKGQRGSRNAHLSRLLSLVLNSDHNAVVNNNAAALYLTLKTLADGKEVIISRGELVEIGGSFRIPDIIEASGAKLVEVGTTNKTKLSDYENAISENTALYLKVHKSNYYMYGFTEEVGLKELAGSAAEHDLRLVFDLGTGLLDRNLYTGMDNEPDVKSALEEGADIVTISCDKLLGGPQAGIVAGEKELISRIARHPMMRVLRVDKMTISALHFVLHNMLYKKTYLEKSNRVVRYINRDMKKKEELAKALAKSLSRLKLEISIIDSKAQCGGGTLPYHFIESKAVLIKLENKGSEADRAFAERLYYDLLAADIPVLAILREGNLLFDVMTMESEDIEIIKANIKQALSRKNRSTDK